jgi:hypothetical protein
MKNKHNFVFGLLVLIIVIIFILFTYHTLFSGADETRTTLVPCEIASKENIYFKDINNQLFDTNIFVKKGFNLNNDKTAYPFGFIFNSLINVPLFALSGCNNYALNIVPLITYLLVTLIVFSIFKHLGLSVNKAIVGSILFSLTNYYLAEYVTYYPDFIIIFLTATAFWILLKNNMIITSYKMTILISLILSFLLSSKITMFPLIFSLLPLYLIYLFKKGVMLSKIFKFTLIFSVIVAFYMFPTYYSFKIGPSYNTEQNANGTATEKPKNKSTASSFLEDYFYPKENGGVLISHIIKDSDFFSINNIYTLFGLLFVPLLVLTKNKFLFSVLIILFFTSFWFWGNMDVYTGSDTFHLRNSHIRYLLPVFIIFYFLGFYYFITMYSKKLNLLLIAFIIIKLMIGLKYEYPFSIYSLTNKTGYFYDGYLERSKIINAGINKNSIVLSAVYDDFDLSYYYKNYGDLKITKQNNKIVYSEIANILNKTDNPIYLLIPKNDSRYSPFTSEELNQLKNEVMTQKVTSNIYDSDKITIFKISNIYKK